MKVTYEVHLSATVDRDAAANFFANPTPLPANWTVEVRHVGKVTLEELPS
jgi:hypothetical protein